MGGSGDSSVTQHSLLRAKRECANLKAINMLGTEPLLYSFSVGFVWCYLALSVITFLVYCWDKSAAKRGAWRVSERTLHLLSLLGGWPGALCAQKLVRHKTKKHSFQIIFWCTVLLNLTCFVLFFTPLGRRVW